MFSGCASDSELHCSDTMTTASGLPSPSLSLAASRRTYFDEFDVLARVSTVTAQGAPSGVAASSLRGSSSGCPLVATLPTSRPPRLRPLRQLFTLQAVHVSQVVV